MSRNIAHDINNEERTIDVRLQDDTPFRKMGISQNVLKGLVDAGYEVPTKIQAMAIPTGRMGIDMLVQSKSGTGKTLIYSAILLEMYNPQIFMPQALIMVPTREIAIQVCQTLNRIGKHCPNFSAIYVIGGINIKEDRGKVIRAKAVVGTPGRTFYLLMNNVLSPGAIKLLVLDEADQLYSPSMKETIIGIQMRLRSQRHTIACSATLTNELTLELSQYMYNPIIMSADAKPTLLIGIKQFAYVLPEPLNSMQEMNSKLEALNHLFTTITFKQCVIFAGSQMRADSYCTALEKDGWPVTLITGAQQQRNRIDIFNRLRSNKTRIIVSTDLFSRGIDCENINLIVNLELPPSVFTYMHRVGRAGRFGTRGIAVTMIAGDKDLKTFTEMMSEIGGGMTVLNFPKSGNVPKDYKFWNFNQLDYESKIFGLFGEYHIMNVSDDDADGASTSKEAALKEAAMKKAALKDELKNEEKNKEKNEPKDNNDKSTSIDTKTFRINSKDSAVNVIDVPMEGSEACPQQKVTPDSQPTSSQHLPSSNTIDDASSIAPDSERSSVQEPDINTATSMQPVIDLLVDNTKKVAKKNAEKERRCDVYDDYEKTVQHVVEVEVYSKPKNPEDLTNVSTLLANKSSCAPPDDDMYSEYRRNDPCEVSSSINDDDNDDEQTESTNSRTFLGEETKNYPSLAQGDKAIKAPSSVCPIDLSELTERCLTLESSPQPSSSSSSSAGDDNSSKIKRKQVLSMTAVEKIDIPPHPVLCTKCSVVVQSRRAVDPRALSHKINQLAITRHIEKEDKKTRKQQAMHDDYMEDTTNDSSNVEEGAVGGDDSFVPNIKKSMAKLMDFRSEPEHDPNDDADDDDDGDDDDDDDDDDSSIIRHFQHQYDSEEEDYNDNYAGHMGFAIQYTPPPNVEVHFPVFGEPYGHVDPDFVHENFDDQEDFIEPDVDLSNHTANNRMVVNLNSNWPVTRANDSQRRNVPMVGMQPVPVAVQVQQVSDDDNDSDDGDDEDDSEDDMDSEDEEDDDSYDDDDGDDEDDDEDDNDDDDENEGHDYDVNENNGNNVDDSDDDENDDDDDEDEDNENNEQVDVGNQNGHAENYNGYIGVPQYYYAGYNNAYAVDFDQWNRMFYQQYEYIRAYPTMCNVYGYYYYPN